MKINLGNRPQTTTIASLMNFLPYGILTKYGYALRKSINKKSLYYHLGSLCTNGYIEETKRILRSGNSSYEVKIYAITVKGIRLIKQYYDVSNMMWFPYFNYDENEYTTFIPQKDIYYKLVENEIYPFLEMCGTTYIYEQKYSFLTIPEMENSKRNLYQV